MSEAENQSTSILLPASTLTIFSNDQETLDAGRNLPQDWRFARVKIAIKQGSVDTAVQYYRENKSPDLVIVQTDEINDMFTEKLGALAGFMDEGTAAIVVGPDNDVNLYRKLIEMGVSDYLVRPLSVDMLAESVAKTLVHKIGVTGSRLVTFVGAKGGIGTSTIAAASAQVVSELFDEKTLYFDGAGGWSISSVMFGFEPSTTLAEAARAAEGNDEDSLMRMIHDAGKKLGVLATGGEVMLEPDVSPEQLEMLLDMVMSKFPVVFGDFSNAPSNLTKTALARANHIVLVSTATVSSLRLARALLLEIKEMRGGNVDEVSLLVNQQGLAGKSDIPYKDIQEVMEFPVSGIIPFDPETFFEMEAEGLKLHETKTGYDIMNKVMIPVLKKALSINKNPDEPTQAAADGLIGGLLNKIKTK